MCSESSRDTSPEDDTAEDFPLSLEILRVGRVCQKISASIFEQPETATVLEKGTSSKVGGRRFPCSSFVEKSSLKEAATDSGEKIYAAFIGRAPIPSEIDISAAVALKRKIPTLAAGQLFRKPQIRKMWPPYKHSMMLPCVGVSMNFSFLTYDSRALMRNFSSS